MFNEEKFRIAIKKAGYSIEEIAKLLNIDVSTLYRKMHGESDFYRREIDVIVSTLNLKNPSEIFFA